jgi:hypothetical protein
MLSKPGIRIPLAASAALLMAALAVSAAAASTAPTWTVRPGGSVAATFSRVIFTDITNGNVLGCRPTLKAMLAAGTGLPGNGIGSVSALTFGTLNCAGALGFKYTLTTSHLPYTLNAASYNATTGTTTGQITGMHASVEGSACSFVLDGTGASAANGILAVTYVNNTRTLTFIKTGDRLHAYNVIGCAGLFQNRDSFALTGARAVTPAQTITSP